MPELFDLYKDMDEQGIRLFPYDVVFADAATIEYGGQYGIFLDMSCFTSISRYKEVLAHEIGHCATGCTHKVSSPLDIVQRHEYKANRWAIERYLPIEDINAAIRQGCAEPWQLAEYFDLPESFICRALTHYTEVRQRAIG